MTQLQNTPAADTESSTGTRIIMGLLPLLILIGLAIAAVGLRMFAPESERRAPPSVQAMPVDVIELRPQRYQVSVESYGTVQPRTRSMLVSQVSGQITSVDARFREGGFFDRGDVLLVIDDRDYRANVEIAQAALLDAQQLLAEEAARSNQASADWERLGNSGPAPALVLRKPQLSAANARVRSAQSQLDKARLELERTQITAPYDGRILSQQVDVGQVVSPGTALGEVYATDYVEVRLPLRDRDLPFVELPEQKAASAEEPKVAVQLNSTLIADETWDGTVVRTESAIDTVARQLHVVAQIDDPFGSAYATRTPLKIGEYVTARIAGKVVENAVVVPTSAIYQSTFAYVAVDDELQQRTVSIVWQNDREALIGSGLLAGDQLITTPLGQVTSGTPIKVRGPESETGDTTRAGSRTRPPPRPEPTS